MTATTVTCSWKPRGANGGAVAVLLLAAFAHAVSSHQVVLPSSFGVLPHPAYAPLPAPAPVPTFLIRTAVPESVPVVETATPTLAPVLPRDHVTPVLRAGAPAILLLPQTPTSGVYHLSDQQHRFPPILENVVNRVQNLFSSYVQVDPYNTPFGTARPPSSPSPPPTSAATAAPVDDGSAAAITTTTTTTTTARTQGQGINLRLLAPAHSAQGGPALPRDVELLNGRYQHQQQTVLGGEQGQGQPVAFASATAQVHGQGSDTDSYLPSANKDGGNSVAERPPAPPAAPSGPSRPGGRPHEDRRYGARGPSRGPPHQGQGPHGGPHGGPHRPVDPSYYRRP